MPSHLARRLLLVLSLVGGLLAPTAAAGAADLVYEVVHVESGDATIRVEIQRDPAHDPQPVLLTYSPYNNLNEDLEGRTATDRLWDTYGPRGYARAVADVIGTRGSTGCWDYGGPAEQRSGIDVVNHLADAPWSNGNVGMIGVSYEGTTANMVAARGDLAPGLKAIVPIAAISRWYGYAYENGVRYFLNSFAPTDEGFDTPLAFDLGFGRTVAPHTAAEDPVAFAEVTGARAAVCDADEHTLEAYDRTPDYDDFWLDRDYVADRDTHPKEYRAAALVVHGWQDFNVKQVEALHMYEALPLDDPRTREQNGVPFKLLWMTQARHANGSGEGYQELLDQFLATTLKDAKPGHELRQAMNRPVRTEGRDLGGALGEAGVQRHREYPPRNTRDVTLHLGRSFDYDVEELPYDGLVGSTGETGVLSPEPQDTGAWTWVDAGTTSELLVENDPLNEDGHGYYSLYYQSEPLQRDVRILGRITVDAWLRPTRAGGATFTPVVLDVAPDGSNRVVERGFLNLDYRNGLEAADPAGDGSWVHAEVELLPQDYTIRAGHRIALLTMSQNAIWAVPGTPAGPVGIANGPIADVTGVGSTLTLPVVGPPGRATHLFDGGRAATTSVLAGLGGPITW